MLRDLRQRQMTGIQASRRQFSTDVRRRLSGAFRRPGRSSMPEAAHAQEFLHQSFTKLLLMGLWMAGMVACAKSTKKRG
ncbi:hypothetical protein ACNKHN_23285 [Shigella flexneri]